MPITFAILRFTGVPMLCKFLDPKNDVAFKKIFGNEKNQDILIHFLNDVLIFKKKTHSKSDFFKNTAGP